MIETWLLLAAARALTSDWSVHSFITVVCEENYF